MDVSAVPKPIRKFKVAVTSACTLRCAYCFVDKSLGETISPAAVREALKLFLGSPGREKKLEVYGGEPFLRFERVRLILDTAFKEARARGKKLRASIATNAFRMRAEHLDYLRRRGVHLSVSFSGSEKVHDRFRKTGKGAGSFAGIAKNLPLVFSRLGKGSVDAIFCVHPKGVSTMAQDFGRLADLGFEHVNIEVVHGFPWPAAARREFAAQMRKIAAFVFERIRSGKRVFLDTFFDYLEPELKDRDFCPFYRDMEIFPNGDYSFYPYPFVSGLKARRRIKVGSTKTGLVPRYRDCLYLPRGRRCSRCRTEYYVLRKVAEGNEPYRERTRALGGLLRRILREARTDPVFKSYARALYARAGKGLR